jgi:TatA/E family protein of Tat protein translocase
MPTPGPLELVIILVIALLILGPGKLPDVGSALGKSIREFRKASSDVQEAVTVNVDTSPLPPAPAPAAAAVAVPAVAAATPVAAAAETPAAPDPTPYVNPYSESAADATVPADSTTVAS